MRVEENELQLNPDPRARNMPSSRCFRAFTEVVDAKRLKIPTSRGGQRRKPDAEQVQGTGQLTERFSSICDEIQNLEKTHHRMSIMRLIATSGLEPTQLTGSADPRPWHGPTP